MDIPLTTQSLPKAHSLIGDSGHHKESKRNFGLDLLRATAILLVVWFHSFAILAPLFQLPYIGAPIKKIYIISTWVGPLGVDLFFVLSGFLIGGILIKSFISQDKYTGDLILRFWINRWLRTIPNYYIIIIVTFALYNYLYQTPINFSYFFFIQNLFTPHPEFFGEAWSLAIEEWFYLSLPIWLFFISSVFRNTEKRKILLLTFLSYAIIFILIRFFRAMSSDAIDLDRNIRKVVIFRLDSIMYGVLMAYLMRFNNEMLLKYKNKLALLGLIGSFLIIGAIFTAIEQTELYKTNKIVEFLINSSYYTLIPFLFSLFIPYLFFFEPKWPSFARNTVLQVSLISYSLYLTHYSLIYTPLFERIQVSSPWTAVALYIFYWALALIVASLAYKFLEMPLMGWRERVKR